MDSLGQIVNQKEVKQEVEEQVEVSNKRSEAYSEDDLKAAWEKYTALCIEKGMTYEVGIMKGGFHFGDETLTVHISNEALEGTFERMRMKLLEFLRGEVKNDHLQLRSKIIELDKKQMLYTDKEKFEHLKKKYPALKDFQSKFGLDPEF